MIAETSAGSGTGDAPAIAPAVGRSSADGTDGEGVFMFKLKPKPKQHKWRAAPKWPKDPAPPNVRQVSWWRVHCGQTGRGGTLRVVSCRFEERRRRGARADCRRVAAAGAPSSAFEGDRKGCIDCSKRKNSARRRTYADDGEAEGA